MASDVLYRGFIAVSQWMECVLGALILAVLASASSQAADLPVDNPVSAVQLAPTNAADPRPADLPILKASDLHKFTFGKQPGESTPGWAYATLTEVSSTGVTMQKWETSKDPDWSILESPTIIPLDQFVSADQQFIKDWAKHPAAPAAPIAVATGTQGIACFFPGYSFLVDTTGVLKGKTITAIASSEEHFLVLCADGTLASWGQNVYGQLGNRRHGVDALSLVPVLVDETGALKGKTITSIGAFLYGNYALCSDGSLFTWGLPPHTFPSEAAAVYRDKPALFDPVALQGKKVVSVSVSPGYDVFFSVLCSDGSLFNWEGVKGGHGITVAVRLNNLGVLQGKEVTRIGDGNKALTSDGTLVRWDPVLVRHLLSVELKEDPVDVPDPTVLLKGKTILAFPEWDLVLFSDGTMAELGAPDAKDPAGRLTQLLNLPVPAGKKITALAGDLWLYSDGTLGFWPRPSGQTEWLNPKTAAFAGALKDKTILAISLNMVLFKEPATSGPIPQP